jgi:diguanylate cyclase (GGDEF)-like protein/PAS domain S-box-containing protein
MLKNKLPDDLPQEVAQEIERLQRENEVVAQQVKRLIKAEGKLYAYQEELDSQLKEYKELYALSRTISATFDIRKIFERSAEYIIRNLEFERAVFFEQFSYSGTYTVCALDGYYNQAEKNNVAPLVINENDPLLSPFHEGAEYLICKAGSDSRELVEYRSKLLMDEYLIYPLCSHKRPHAFLAVGNSAANAEFYRRVSDSEGALLGIGNLVGLLISGVENHIYNTNMIAALELEKRAEKKYHELVENINVGIYQTSPGKAGRFLQANPAMAKMFGYDSVGDLLETPVSNLYQDPEDRVRLFDELRVKGAVNDVEIAMKKKDGAPLWASITITAQYDDTGRIKWADGVMEDVSERKRAREELQKAHDELEMRVQERTADLARANELLQGEITERKKAEEKLRELSEKDPLTAIFNRRKLYELMDVEIDRAKRYERPLSLIMFDFDYFKKINDTYGHTVGDIVLQSSAKLIGCVIRRVDIFARYGGEEFIILVPETGVAGAVALAEKIRRFVHQHAYPEVGKVTVSAGVAAFVGNDTKETLIKRADDALYKAKEKGRNRVETFIS